MPHAFQSKTAATAPPRQVSFENFDVFNYEHLQFTGWDRNSLGKEVGNQIEQNLGPVGRRHSNLAFTLAKSIHKHQTRWDEQPYVTHLLKVFILVYRIQEHFKIDPEFNQLKSLYNRAIFLHDAPEDHPRPLAFEGIQAQNMTLIDSEVKKALKAMDYFQIMEQALFYVQYYCDDDPRVRNLVDSLTFKIPPESDHTEKTIRKFDHYTALSQAGVQSRLIKVADKVQNLCDILRHPKKALEKFPKEYYEVRILFKPVIMSFKDSHPEFVKWFYWLLDTLKKDFISRYDQQLTTQELDFLRRV